MEQVTSTTARPAISLTAARLAFGMGSTALVLLVVLHFLSPEFDPSWRMVSEYALGSHHWVLSLMFLAWAGTGFTLFFALRSQIRTPGGKIGLGLLFVSAVGAGLSSIFDVTNSLHGLAALLGIPTLPIAALILSVSLTRNPAWAAARRPLLLMAHLSWISLGLMVAMLFIGLSQTGGQFGPGVWIGWPNRLLVLAHIGWMISAARRAIQIDRR